jgi:iron complex transport system ATP-binding protein
MASHVPDHAFLVANVVAILNNGGIRHIGTPDEVITESNLKVAYGADVCVVCEGDRVERKVCFPVMKDRMPPARIREM